MAVDPEYLIFLREQMAGVGPVATRRMFSGAGFSLDGVVFALYLRDALYLKTDEASRAAFENEGLIPFSYQTKKGTITVKAYYRAPERCMDDMDEMTIWCRRAYDAAVAAKKPKPKPKLKRAKSKS